MFNKQSKSIPATPLANKSISDLRTELETADSSLEQLGHRQDEAASELAGAQVEYDAEMAAFALGKSPAEPSRDRIQEAADRVASLLRVRRSLAGQIPAMQSALANAELNTAVTEGRALIPALTASGDAKLGELVSAAEVFRRTEGELFSVMFDVKAGLKQGFASEELTREAFQQRFRLRRAVADIEQRFKIPADPRFSTDGLQNLSPDYITLTRFFASRKVAG